MEKDLSVPPVGDYVALPPVQTGATSLAWQSRLLPWMIVLPTILILVFIYLATTQLSVFSKQVNTYKQSELDGVFMRAADSTLRIPPGVNSDRFVQLYLLSRMDEQLMNKRYSQGGVLLLSRLYTKYLGFFTGMILAIVGAVFIISKLSETESRIKGNYGNASLSLISASPGIIFAVLGTTLMLVTIVRHNDINIIDVATYVPAGYHGSSTEMSVGPATGVAPATVTDSAHIDSLMRQSSPYQLK